MKNESNTYDKPLNTVAEWGQKFNATVNTFNSKNDLFSEWTEKMLIQLPCSRKMNINSFQLSNTNVRQKFIYAVQRVSELSGIEITINGSDSNSFVFYKNEKIK